jgi:hypothetical protein
MSPTAYAVQMAAAEKALMLARDVGDLAAMLAALATMTRIVRLQYGRPSSGPDEARARVPLSCATARGSH